MTRRTDPLPPSPGSPLSLEPPSEAPPARDVEALRWSEARLRALVDFTSQVFWTSSAEGQGHDSPSWRSFTGQSAAELRQPGGWLNALHPDDRALAVQAWAHAIAQRVPFEVRYRMRRWDGPYVWMLARGLPLLDAEGGVREWVGSLTDIHAQQRAEERAAFLAHAGELLAGSLDYSAILALLSRLTVPELGDWCIVDVLQASGQFERAQVTSSQPSQALLVEEVRALVPVPSEHPVYPPAVALIHGRPSLVAEVTDEVMQRVAHSAHHLDTMRRLGMRSLITVPLIARNRILGAITCLMTDSGRRYGAEDLRFLQEVAHRAALSVDNARLYREAQEAIRLRDEFLSIASHELKTPLTPLSLKLQALERAAEAQPQAPLASLVRSHVESGRRQLRKLTSLIHDLLDVSRIRAGSFRGHREPVDLAVLVREVAEQLAPRATQVDSPITVRAERPARGQWDRPRLEQMVAHLLDNALKYGAGKPIHVEVAVDGTLARLTVRDEGIGIPPEQLGRVFERYARAVSERHYGGLGLGLYITRAIVEDEGGRVSVDSVPGQGATFTVELPLSVP